MINPGLVETETPEATGKEYEAISEMSSQASGIWLKRSLIGAKEPSGINAARREIA